MTGFKFSLARLSPGDYGDEHLDLRLVPAKASSTTADKIGAAVTMLIKSAGAKFKGKSVRVTVEDLQLCRVCGCWEEDACDGGCSWAAPNLCSACTPAALAARGEGP